MNTIDIPSLTLTATEGKPQAGTCTVHVDGSSLRNPGPAGWAVTISALDGSRRVLTGSARKATNNQMELWAVFEALSALPADATGVLYADSLYVIDGLTKWRRNWARRSWRKADGSPVANATLWKLVGNAADARPGIRLGWVRGHAGNTGNTLADRLARAEAEKVQAGMGPAGGCEVILEDCALEDAEANLRWMNAPEVMVEAS